MKSEILDQKFKKKFKKKTPGEEIFQTPKVQKEKKVQKLCTILGRSIFLGGEIEKKKLVSNRL